MTLLIDTVLMELVVSGVDIDGKVSGVELYLELDTHNIELQLEATR